MGMHQYFYIGSYLRVYMPKYERKSGVQYCPNCEKQSLSKFCGSCGSEMQNQMVQIMLHPYELVEEHFGDGDEFSYHQLHDEKDYYIVMPNTVGDEAGATFSEYNSDGEFESEIPDGGFSDNWNKLMEILDANDIGYEERRGVVGYFY